MRDQDQQSRDFYDLCAQIHNVLRSPPLPIPYSSLSAVMAPWAWPSFSRTPMTTTTQVSPAGFASLFLGISIALMLCGSVTFLIGFMLMPWVLGFVMVFNVIGLFSNLSGIGRAILCPTTPTSSPSRKDLSGQRSPCRSCQFSR
uniref:Uncharacterized protein n=1 Tax=Nelumbo nucifera TaxID=4432 RepID=A0A822YGY5_NELNU|nr:TPA_asm: hypothetical protein HUJ06_009380 [Nelumbo nucifera]